MRISARRFRTSRFHRARTRRDRARHTSADIRKKPAGHVLAGRFRDQA